MLLSFLGMLSVLFLLGGSQFASGETLYVDDDGGAGHTTINSALENATDGDIIMIHPGEYDETIEVDKEVTFASTTGNPEDVVVYNMGGYSIFNVFRDNVTISGMTVKYGTCTIFLHSSDNCLIENNIITLGAIGILVDGNYQDGASNNTIIGSPAINGEYGIYLVAADRTTITGNSIRDTSYGLYLSEDCDRNMVSRNTISGSAVTGIHIGVAEYHHRRQ